MLARRHHTRLPFAALAAVVAAGLLVATPARAARSVALTDAADTVAWVGTFTTAAGPSVPEVCADLACDETVLHLELPGGTFSTAAPGGVEVAVRWHDEADDLDLFVYAPDGSLAARSDGFFASTGESVVLDRPANGDYRVVVSARLVDHDDFFYEGIAQVERPPAVAPVRDLLPDLVPLPPANLHYQIGAYLFDPETPTDDLATCYPEESVEQGAGRCLRFDQTIANLGAGPFELRFLLDTVGTTNRLVQRVYRSDGTSSDADAGTYTLHPAHGHFHDDGFAQSYLWAADAGGTVTASTPVRTGRKRGFCMIDVEPIHFGEHGDAPRTYRFPACNTPQHVAPGDAPMVNGISVGWADVYNWYLADQFIEVSGLPAGFYVLETHAVPDGLVREQTAANNRACSFIELTDTDANVITSPTPCP